ncbi:ANTH-domain-containing protein [Sistotremastrum suecicum HHB10207 ss-3]|uniref:ANTH-domain-containing protein n=1 Tax=Sistotremastrum suecicum HHB10207 ss-3 TaxID=1314776 RepID=A0A166CS59_9AGAM|nr:ANTH-domain-containing protein [Sistotremastrum suecicum HHB10207 ss-3]
MVLSGQSTNMNSGSSYEKVVKLACKPKHAPPKAKYLDPIIAATWSDDGAVHDVCRALAPRFKEPNAIIVFKAMIVLHTMVRTGSTDNVLTSLTSSEVLKLSNVFNGQWEGYSAPENLQRYAKYMDTRIKAYRELKHDAIRVQSESNRDMLVNQAENGRMAGSGSNGSLTRSKTIAGRKLKVMTVEKGLLRETKIVQKQIDALLECKFYEDDLEDELVLSALRMLLKDLLVLFQACNEGVINVLEHYFEMSHVDATSALALYRHFCSQTKRVVDYLAIGRKLQNLLNVSIPNLKHAPVSLAGSLEEYLNDPNFEQNRIEYKTTKQAADSNGKSAPKSALKKPDQPKSGPSIKFQDPMPRGASGSTPNNNNADDFFKSIEQEQSTIFNPQTNSPSSNYFQQQSQHNPFANRQSMMMTGAGPFPFAAQPTGMIPQPTGFQPQPFLAPQQTGSPFQGQSGGFLQAQPTGNPFRQSMLFPQSTGMPNFANPSAGNPFGMGAPAPPAVPSFTQPQSAYTPAFSRPKSPEGPPRPQSTPITTLQQQQPTAKPLVSHQTGSRNPFGIPVAPAPPVPQPPTLNQLATGNFNQFSSQANDPNSNANAGSASPPHRSNTSPLSSAFTGMSSLASSFATGGTTTGSTAPTTLGSQSTANSSFLGGQNAFNSSPDSAPAPLQPQQTGFGGIKPFKPSSSFGASLLEALPSIPGSNPATPAGAGGLPLPSSQSLPSASNSASNSAQGTSYFGGLSSQPTGFGALNSNVNSNPTGSFSTTFGTGQNTTSTVGVGLRPQITGGGVANPFRASMLNPSAAPPLPSSNSFPSFTSTLSPSSSLPPPFRPTSSFGKSAAASLGTGNPFPQGGNSNMFGQPQQQQNAPVSLI